MIMISVNKISVNNEESVLHQAAGIIRNHINNISSSDSYPQPHEVSEISSEKFVPLALQKFLSWCISKNSFLTAQIICDKNSKSVDELKSPKKSESDNKNKIDKKRMLALCECIIYCIRKGKKQIIPPFHYGLMIQMHHNYGSRSLIEILNAFGFCGSYDQLRFFLTTAAEYEIEKNVAIY